MTALSFKIDISKNNADFNDFKGISDYINKELFSQMTELQEFLARLALGRFIGNEETIKEALINNGFIRTFGLIDRDGMIDVDAIAKEAGNPRGANIVLLGACSHLLGIEPEKFEQGIERIFARKGAEVVESNLKAFKAGQKAAGIL